MVRKVCSMSHGQPCWRSRSQAMTASRRLNGSLGSDSAVGRSGRGFMGWGCMPALEEWHQPALRRPLEVAEADGRQTEEQAEIGEPDRREGRLGKWQQIRSDEHGEERNVNEIDRIADIAEVGARPSLQELG